MYPPQKNPLLPLAPIYLLQNPEQVPVPEGITCTAPALWLVLGIRLGSLGFSWLQSVEIEGSNLKHFWFYLYLPPGHRAAGFRRRAEEPLAGSLAGCWCPASPHTAKRKDEQCTPCLPAVWCQICLAASISQLTAEGLGLFLSPPPPSSLLFAFTSRAGEGRRRAMSIPAVLEWLKEKYQKLLK